MKRFFAELDGDIGDIGDIGGIYRHIRFEAIDIDEAKGIAHDAAYDNYTSYEDTENEGETPYFAIVSEYNEEEHGEFFEFDNSTEWEVLN